MAGKLGSMLFLLLVLICSTAVAQPTLNRRNFPRGFIFGAGSAAYQNEGAAFEGGKGPSVWDNFTHQHPEKIIDRSNGDVAIDQYHRYKEDVRLAKETGLDSYRFSISWPRLLPTGKLSGGVNKEGIKYYNNLINELLANGLKPFVTLYHWDLPQALEDEYHGLLSRRFVDDFKEYSDLCFKEFGDRVKHWVTFNEPTAITSAGYTFGSFPPGDAKNPGTEPYVVTHNILLAHAAAVRLYKKKYQAHQKGLIGITLVTQWLEPLSKTAHDKRAQERALDFSWGWYLQPLTYGHYPRSMRTILGERLPKFTPRESINVRRSFDFIGVNYYTSQYVSGPLLRGPVDPRNASAATDPGVKTNATGLNGKLIGPSPIGTTFNTLYYYPEGLRKLLVYTKRKYDNPVIYVTENGIYQVENQIKSRQDALNDQFRIKYLRGHLSSLKQAINEGVRVRGYFAWSLFDNFEWSLGYTVRYGLIYVDRKDGLKRYPKDSAKWYKKFLKK